MEAITTNSIEGGNWRRKFELRTAYSVLESITARTLLICLNNSIFTFRKGVPIESFAHKCSNFTFEKVYGIIEQKYGKKDILKYED